MAAKLIVNLPYGWDNKLIVDSKDFSTLCDIFERATCFTPEYKAGKNRRVLKKATISAEMFDGEHPMTKEVFDAIQEASDEG